MTKLITGTQLISEIDGIFKNAKSQLIIISPFIKMSPNYAATIKEKIKQHKLKIILVFGKNEGKLVNSLNYQDLTFFAKFPNIEIRYEKRLHAKCYANEKSCVVTSMNLLLSSHENIEIGIKLKSDILDNIISLETNSLDVQANKIFQQIIKDSELMFKKSPEYSGRLLKKKYTGSVVQVNRCKEFYEPGKPKVNKYSSVHII
jgi:hypothetical protein